LVNGVSQQADTQRLPSQVELQENFIPSVSDGLVKRPGTDHLKVLDAANLPADAYYHFMDLGDRGQYVACISSGSCRVFSLADGTEQTVVLGTSAAAFLTTYWDSGVTTPYSRSYCAASLDGYSLVANRSVRVNFKTSSGAYTIPNQYALVEVRQGAYSTDYQVRIKITCANGVTTTYSSTKTTSASTASDIKTSQIASDLAAGGSWSPALPAQITVNRLDSVLSIYTASGLTISSSPAVSMTVEVADSAGGQYIKGTNLPGSVQQFSDLPSGIGIVSAGPVKVIGAGGTALASPYYVSFSAFDSSAPLGTLTKGAWVESTGLGSGTAVFQGHFSTSMPYKLSKSETLANTFNLDPLVWDSSPVGDTSVNPLPSYVTAFSGTYSGPISAGATLGQRINDLFVHKNRLGIISDGGVSLSCHGQYTKFFRQTCVTVLDTDPIDFKIPQTKSSPLRWGVPFSGGLVVYTDYGQYLIPGDKDLLSSKTITSSIVSQYEAATTCRPESTAGMLYFPCKVGAYSRLREFSGSFKSFDALGGVADAPDVTAHVPKYLSGNVVKLSGTTRHNCVAVQVDGDTSSLYLYDYEWTPDQNQKIQSAWHKFTFGTTAVVKAAEFVGQYLYLVIDRPSKGTHLERLDLATSLTDTGLSFRLCLDRRITEATCTVSYSAVTGLTTWTLPYQIVDSLQVLVRTAAGSLRLGQVIPTASQSGNQITASGNYSATQVYIGQPVTSRVRFSKLYPRDQNGQAINTGRLQLRTMSAAYNSTGYLRAEVTPTGRSMTTQTMAPQVGVAFTPGSPVLATGVLRFPVLALNTEAQVDLVSDSYLPCRITSASWEGTYTNRARQS
jgi:hypothetical protein